MAEATPQFRSKQLHHRLTELRKVDNWTNWRWLLGDYATLAVTAGAAVFFFEHRAGWGLAWAWNVPIALLAIVIIGGVQHRLAGLAHEASHYTLFKHRLLNELASDLFCLFPLFATTQQYRLAHMAHHQYVNDWERDPDLQQIGKSKMMDQFPMSRGRFIWNFYLKFLFPVIMLRYMWDIMHLSVFGAAHSPYLKTEHGKGDPPSFRPMTVLGTIYLFGLAFVMNGLNQRGYGVGVLAVPALTLAVGLAAIALAPGRWFFPSPFHEAYSSKVSATLRLTFFTALLTTFAGLRLWTGVNWGPTYLILWVIPLFTTFMYYMLLRDVYQHANADQGRLTNSRVFFTDIFTHWAVFVYGQDIHIPHHLFPAIPHYHLLEAHRVLLSDPQYAATVVECHGTFVNGGDHPTILDMMTPANAPPAGQSTSTAA